jgi:sugar phosphate isomerase/epimerase
MKIGSTTLPLAGWMVVPGQPEESRKRRLQAIRSLVEDYNLGAVELTLDFNIIYPDVFNIKFYADVAELQQKLGFVCTIHLPFLWMDCASMNDHIRQASVDSVQQAIENVDPIFVQTYVLHLWGNTSSQVSSLIEDPLQRSFVLRALQLKAEQSLETISEFVEPPKICVENLESPGYEFASPLVEKFGTGVCLDVGHLAYHDLDVNVFLEQHGDRIREVHLHDAAKKVINGTLRTIDHMALGEGNIDYKTFLKGLTDIGYDGAVILENNTRADLDQSLSCLRDYL